MRYPLLVVALITAAIPCAAGALAPPQVTGHSGVLTWTASPLPAPSGSITATGVAYNVYRGGVSGGPYTKLNTAVIAATTYTDATVSAGQTYYWVATAVATYSNGTTQESAYSNQVSGTVPASTAPLVLATTSLPSATAGVSYSDALAASGGVAPYTWVVTGLPSGLSATPAGVLSGTATASGSFALAVTVTDSETPPVSASGVLTLSVAPPTPLQVTTTSLPSGTVGATYSASVVAAGGVAPYTWSVTGLPPGLVASGGTISGTPTAAGSSTVTVAVTDSETPPVTVSSKLTLTISAASSFTPVYFKAGAAYTDSQGDVWVADTKYCSGGNTYATTHAITGALPMTTDGALYQTQRYNNGTTSLATCTIPAPAGSYTVTAKLAEIYFGGAGDRVFNLLIDGVTVLSNFDVYKSAGAEYKALDETFAVTTTGANIVITMTNVTNNAQYEAFSIVQSGPPPVTVALAPASTSVVEGGSVQFTATVTNTANTAVTWSSDAPAGLFTAGATPGTYTVTATSVADPTKSASATVTITAPPPAMTVTCAAVGVTWQCTFTPANIPVGAGITVTGVSDGVTATSTGVLP